MFSCNYCSLAFTTEEKLNVHIEMCDRNTQSPLSELSDLDSYTCEVCSTDFLTAEELAMHEKTCEMKKLTSTLVPQLEELTRTLNIPDKPVSLKSKRCGNCKMIFITREDLLAHRRMCKIRKVNKLMKGLTTIFEEWCKKFKSVKENFFLSTSSVSPVSSDSSSSSYLPISDESNVQTSHTLTSEDDCSVQTNLINPVAVGRAICSAMPSSTSKDCSVKKSNRKRPLKTSSTFDSSLVTKILRNKRKRCAI
ncbi:uncharacterized protein LOC109851734 [Pseudomyrmex gracilis]|uniref:uncharacterized protein LOC109851734 n=1 Tax=Pseudomyrmex gracilis TaxID=219809 RepID=UPI0009958AF4|nr:uncharacterized protein LOC109851734 [Pseudomyrmex gracilis]